MADIATLLADQGRSLDTGAFIINRDFSFSATQGANGDRVQLITVEHAMRLFDLVLGVSATLGAACTIKAQLNRGGVHTDLTAATTAAAAGNKRMTAAPQTLAAGDIIEVLIAGADVAAAATVTVDALVQRA